MEARRLEARRVEVHRLEARRVEVRRLGTRRHLEARLQAYAAGRKVGLGKPSHPSLSAAKRPRTRTRILSFPFFLSL